ncbi:MAG: glycine betaine ABC transporter substrate-binding protein [Thermoleophilia bacterium]
MIPRSRIGIAACAISLPLVLTACGSSSSSSGGSSTTGAGAGTTVRIADKGFTESRVVADAYAAALKEAGFSTSVKSLASSQLADGAVRNGQIDMYPEYDGTTFLTILKKTTAQAPKSRDAFFALVQKGSAARGLTALPPAPYNNGNEVACTKDAVAKYHITDLSALGKASPNLTYSANAEHLTRADGLPLLSKTYGVHFKKVITVDITLRYKPIQGGQAQCVYAFGTDPQLAKLPLVLIKDDKGAFAGTVPFRTYPVVNAKWLAGLSPDVRTAFTATLAKVDAALTQTKIQQLNASVDIDKEDPSDVADTFVKSLGAM